MNILYIGSLNEFGTKVCNYLATYYPITAESKEQSIYEADYQYIDTTRVMEVEDEHYDTVILYSTDNIDLKYVNTRLNFLCKRTVKQVFLIEERSIFRKRPFEKSISKMILKELERTYGTKLTFISCSCLYGEVDMPIYISQKVHEITKKNTITPLGAEDETCDCLYINDFCIALKLILEGTYTSENSTVEVQSSYLFTLNSLIEILKERYKQVTVSDYTTECDTICYSSFQSNEWSPKGNFLQDMPYILNVEEGTYSNLKKFKRKKSFNTILKVIAYVCIFVLVELYAEFVTVSSDLQYVDLRLLYVCACSLIEGKRLGVISAGICSIASIVQRLIGGYRWYVLFYHIDNWIPIAVYFVIAVLISEYRECLLNKSK
jgi:hypothetical protein